VPLAQNAGRDRLVVMPDLPGLGASDLPDVPDITIEALGSYLGAVLQDFVGEPADLYGTHTGAAISLDWADTGKFPTRSVLLDGMMLEGAYPSREELLERYAQPLPADAHGLHLLEAWHRLRDMMLFWPWYRHDANAVRRGIGLPSPRVLHALVVDFLAANCTYHHLYQAAFRYRAEERLRRLSVPTILSAQPGDPLGAWLPEAHSFSSSVKVKPGILAGGAAGVASLLTDLSRRVK
jgi:pimeloyl-ACP methyl ester carboxylesterase